MPDPQYGVLGVPDPGLFASNPVYELGSSKVYNALNPKYGIKGDATDENVVVNAFLTTAGGAVAFFPVPPVKYGTGTTLNPLSYTSICGDGFNSRVDGLTANMIIWGMSDVEGLAFDNFRTTGIGPWNVAGRAAFWSAQGVSYGVRKSKFTRLWIDGVGTCGFAQSDSYECQYDDIDIRNTLEHGFYVSGGTSGTHDLVGGNITIVNAGIGSTSGGVSAIKLAAAGPGTLKRVVLSPVQIQNTLHDGILYESGATDSFVGGTVDGSGQSNVRYNAGALRNGFQGRSTNAAVTSVRCFGGGRNKFVGEIDAPNNTAIQVDSPTTEMFIDALITGSCGAGWAVDNSGTDTLIKAYIANSVGNGVAIRAAAVRHTEVCVVNNATGTKRTDFGATSTRLLNPDVIQMRDNNALISIANATAGTFGLVIDLVNGTYAFGVPGNGASTASIGAAGSRYINMDATGMKFFGGATVAKPTVTGSRAANAALASALTALANLGLLTDSSTA